MAFRPPPTSVNGPPKLAGLALVVTGRETDCPRGISRSAAAPNTAMATKSQSNFRMVLTVDLGGAFSVKERSFLTQRPKRLHSGSNHLLLPA